MNEEQLTETQDMVLSFTKFGMYLISIIILFVGIGLIQMGDYLFGGIAIGQFVFVCISIRKLTTKYQSFTNVGVNQ